MSETYKFKFRSDRFEVEVESDDQAFLMSQMKQLIEWSREMDSGVRLIPPPAEEPAASEPAAEEEAAPIEDAAPVEEALAAETPKRKTTRGRGRKKTKPAAKRMAKKPAKKTTAAKPKKEKAPAKDTSLVEDAEVEVDAAQVAAEVRKSEFFNFLNKEVIEKSNQLNRILMALYYARHVYGDRGFSTGIIEEITTQLEATLRRSNIAAQLKKNPELFAWDKEPARGVTVNYKLKAKGGKTFEDLLKQS